jgi:hypothetical protein
MTWGSMGAQSGVNVIPRARRGRSGDVCVSSLLGHLTSVDFSSNWLASECIGREGSVLRMCITCQSPYQHSDQTREIL